MKNLTLDLFLGDSFYGTLRIPDKWGNIFIPSVEELKAIVESRLPLLKNKNYIIKL